MPHPIDLASAAPFTLGPLQIHPPTLEITCGERRETLEPRIMQVFVALHRRLGEVVSRDVLIDECWDGRTVGDDAINRCIARLRRLAEAEGGFRIETIPRVGYRLVSDEQNPHITAELASACGSGKEQATGQLVWWRSRTAVIIAMLAFAVVVAVVTSFRLAQDGRPPSTGRVAVLSFEPLGSAQNLHIFSEAVAEQIVGVLNENQVQAVSRAQTKNLRGPDRDSAARKLRADFILDGTVQHAGGGLHVTVHLDRTSTHTTLWTTTFDQRGQDIVDLQSQVAARVVDEIKAALRIAGTGDDAAIAAYLKAQENAREGGKTATALRHDQMRIVVARAPNSSAGQSGLAVSAAQLSQFAEGTDIEALRQEAQSAIARALELDPKNGEAYVAKASLVPIADFSRQEAVFRKGLAVDPDEPTLNSSLAALMWDVGRWNEARALQQRAVMLDPLSPRKTASLAALEAQAGNLVRARAIIDQAAKLWPANLNVWTNRVVILTDTNGSKEAQKLLSSPEALPAGLEPDILSTVRTFVKAVSERSPANSAAAKRQLLGAVSDGRMNFEAAIFLLARMGDIDGAYNLTGRFFTTPDSETRRFRHDTAVLLQPDTAALRRDRRFLPLVERLNLVSYWKTHGAPDFCKAESNPVCSRLPAPHALEHVD